MSYKPESRYARETSTTSDMWMIPLHLQKAKRKLESLLTTVKDRSERAGLRLNIKEN